MASLVLFVIKSYRTFLLDMAMSIFLMSLRVNEMNVAISSSNVIATFMLSFRALLVRRGNLNLIQFQLRRTEGLSLAITQRLSFSTCFISFLSNTLYPPSIMTVLSTMPSNISSVTPSSDKLIASPIFFIHFSISAKPS